MSNNQYENTFKDEQKVTFKNRMSEKELILIDSFLQISLVAKGESDIYPRLLTTMEWDTVAIHVAVILAGARVLIFNLYLRVQE